MLESIASDRDTVTVGGVTKHVYSYLADFLFTPERARTPVKALSGGEKARLLLAEWGANPAKASQLTALKAAIAAFTYEEIAANGPEPALNRLRALLN